MNPTPNPTAREIAKEIFALNDTADELITAIESAITAKDTEIARLNGEVEALRKDSPCCGSCIDDSNEGYGLPDDDCCCRHRHDEKITHLSHRLEQVVEALEGYAIHQGWCAYLRAEIRRCDCPARYAVEALTPTPDVGKKKDDENFNLKSELEHLKDHAMNGPFGDGSGKSCGCGICNRLRAGRKCAKAINAHKDSPHFMWADVMDALTAARGAGLL